MLIEIQDKPMVQLAIENLQQIEQEKRFIFIIKKNDALQFHLADTLRLLAGSNCEVIILDRETQGAACSALMAIDIINNDESLLIANFDQIFDCDLNITLATINHKNADAGCLVFDSTHPRWSFVLLDESSSVMETAEKRPLSRNAIAGFYYFKHGACFVAAAQEMIRKSCSASDSFFIAPTFNELILKNKSIHAVAIPTSQYHSFYTPQKIEEYEKSL
nr:glycosyltransferase family 2 protein [Polynucleobacter brandtiae]